MTKRQKIQCKRKLFIANPFCHWCGNRVSYRKKNWENRATLDHIYGKNHPTRKGEKDGPVVLACYLCNQKRGHPVGIGNIPRGALFDI